MAYRSEEAGLRARLDELESELQTVHHEREAHEREIERLRRAAEGYRVALTERRPAPPSWETVRWVAIGTWIAPAGLFGVAFLMAVYGDDREAMVVLNLCVALAVFGPALLWARLGTLTTAWLGVVAKVAIVAVLAIEWGWPTPYEMMDKRAGWFFGWVPSLLLSSAAIELLIARKRCRDEDG